jgi:hypothetical protein
MLCDWDIHCHIKKEKEKAIDKHIYICTYKMFSMKTKVKAVSSTSRLAILDTELIADNIGNKKVYC